MQPSVPVHRFSAYILHMEDTRKLTYGNYISLCSLVAVRPLPVTVSWSTDCPEAENAADAVRIIRQRKVEPGVSSFDSGWISVASDAYKNRTGEPFVISLKVEDIVRCGFMLSTRTGTREGFYLFSGKRTLFRTKKEIELFVHSSGIILHLDGKTAEYRRMLV